MAMAMEEVQLRSGCTNVVLTWPRFMPVAWVVETVRPTGAVDSIWRYWPSDGRFVGYAPDAPESANDYTATIENLEPVFLCLRQSATLTRPVAIGP
jgi:hypothetical protein